MTSARHVLTILAVDDVARAAAFYRGAFGWTAAVELPHYVELALPGGMRLGLYARAGFANNTGARPADRPVAPEGLAPMTTATELYLHVDDLDAAEAALASQGARRLSARAARDWGDVAAYYADPDGNVVVVARPT